MHRERHIHTIKHKDTHIHTYTQSTPINAPLSPHLGGEGHDLLNIVVVERWGQGHAMDDVAGQDLADLY
jgi:hypothetical protein